MEATQRPQDLYANAANFYDNAPTGQYDEEAAHALRCHHELLEALSEIVHQIDQGGSGGKVFARDYCITSARAAIAKATGGAA